MKRVLVGIFLWLALLASNGLAQDSGGVVSGDTLTIYYQTGDLADGTDPAKINWPGNIDHFIDLANQGKYVFCVEAQSDTTGWRWIRQTLRGTSAGAGVNLKKVNRVEDFGANEVRASNGVRFLVWKGLTSKLVFKELKGGDRVFIKIYPTPLPQPETKFVERIVERQAPERPAMTMDLSGLKMPKLPKLAFALQPGVSSTWHSAAPALCFNLVYGHWLAQAYGFHSLFIRYEREVLGGQYDTYDQGAGVLFGRQLSRPLWLVAGYSVQENLLDDTDQAGRRLFRFRGGEAGLLIVPVNGLTVNLTGLYGHVKNWDASETTDVGCRVAVYFGKKWRG